MSARAQAVHVGCEYLSRWLAVFISVVVQKHIKRSHCVVLVSRIHPSIENSAFKDHFTYLS